ncbi:MAG: DUF859 family phage minor structural protein [Acutalibacteraceae bacterium]
MIIYGSCTGSSGSKYNVWLDIVQNSRNIADNTSNITVVLKLKRNDGYASSAWNGYLNQNTAKITVNGSVKFDNNMTFDTRNSATAVLASWTGNVTHDSDGTYSKTIKGEFTTGNSGVSGGSVSGTFTATTIPRSSTLSLSNTSRNPTQDITSTITTASSAFSHKITYSIGSHSSVNTIAAGTTTHLFTIPQSWANAVTSGTSGQVTVTLQTLSGSTVIGTKAYTFNLVIPNTAVYQPGFTIALTRQDNDVPASWGGFVQGKSGVSVNISGASYKYSATHKSVVVTVGGIQKTSLPAVYSPLNSSGTVNISVKVTDSRGLSATKTTSITVWGYAAPSAKFTSVYFSDDLGYVDENGGYIRAYISYSASPCEGKNTLNTTLKYRQFGGDWSDNITHTASGGSVAVTLGSGSLSSANTYELMFTVEDGFTQYETVYKLGTAFVAFNIKKGGKGAAFGKYAETDNLLEVDYDLKVNGVCEKTLLWSSETVLLPTNSVTLSDDLLKYRLCAMRANAGVTHMLSVVDTNGLVRATGSFAASDKIEIYSVRGTYVQSTKLFTLDEIVAFEIKTSGITQLANFTGIQEIWGIK